jgi:hypothetical protein
MRLRSFPSSVGSSWTYEWENRNRKTIDTVVVRVAGELDSSDIGPAKIWVIEHAAKPDTLYMTVVGDTVRFVRWLVPDAFSTAYVFPLRIGAVWRSNWWKDSSWVPAREVVSVPAGNFSPAYRVQEEWGRTNDYGWVTTWVVPEVGIVMEDRLTLSLGPWENYVRRLLVYEIAGNDG